jgi:hypothetical protein
MAEQRREESRRALCQVRVDRVERRLNVVRGLLRVEEIDVDSSEQRRIELERVRK